jgi:hypothetical protein
MSTSTKRPRQRTRNRNKVFEGGHYARSEEEPYKKAIELLDRCRVETRR